jgi:hypothetical protein
VTKRLSISDPRYNVREIVKQMILLEQHLLEKDKYCPDCISKHLLTIEALAEEAQCLDTKQQWCKLMEPLVTHSKAWSAAYAGGVKSAKLGQAVRAVRKQLAPHVVAPVGSTEVSELLEVASIAGDFAGPNEGTDSWKVWGLIAGALCLGVWYGESRRSM